MTKLTDVQIRNWVRSGLSVARSDGGGLTFTLSAKGTAAWVLRYRYGGRPRELTLGRYPDIGLAKARELATAARAQIQQGKDVARDKQTNNAEKAAARTFRDLAASYMAVAFPGMAKSTIQHRRRHIEKDLLPRLGPIAAREVTPADIVTTIEAVGKRSLSVAELVFTAASEIFKHGIARHTVITNPCAGISVSAICGKRQPRTHAGRSCASVDGELDCALYRCGCAAARLGRTACAVGALLSAGAIIAEQQRLRACQG